MHPIGIRTPRLLRVYRWWTTQDPRSLPGLGGPVRADTADEAGG